MAFKYYDIAKPMTYLPSTMFAAPVVANRAWLKSLGPELEKIVREESRKAEEVFGEWDINDIKAKEDIWRKNGGEIITMSPVRTCRPMRAKWRGAKQSPREQWRTVFDGCGCGPTASRFASVEGILAAS